MIGGEWRQLGDLTEADRPITYGVVKPGEEPEEGGVILIRGGDIANGRIAASLRRITDEVSKPYKRTLLKGGELVMSLVGNPGSVAVVPQELRGANLARQAALIALRPEVESRYLMYWFMAPAGQQRLAAVTKGSVQQVINLADLKRQEVLLPPIENQRRIAGILGAYDDLIEVNRRRVAVLEDMARGLFEEWFVRLRFPGHESVPLHNTPDGPLPEGWERAPLGSVCKMARSGSTPSRKCDDYWIDGVVDWFTTGELNDGFLFQSKERISAQAMTEGKARLFPAGTVFIALYGATIGKLGIATSECSTNQASLGLIADGERMGQWQLFHCLQGLKEWFISVGQGAAQQNISKEKVIAAQVTLATREVAQRFDSLVEPIWRLRQACEQQIRSLAASRDLLLPRLMSGGFSLAEAQKELEIA